ncbi:MAG: OmpA family protein, partial [Gammaproteobacteria bacterium]|nr:OmpA family protein [Gammaproteobacteria bacterium]
GKVPGFGDLTLCVVGGAVAGGTAGALVGEVVGGVMGVLAGAVMGDVLCNVDEAEQAAAMTMTDADGDGVADDRDACPNTPSGVAVDAAGCPLYTDADSVPDYLDQCPGTPSGVQVDDKGCPIVVAVAVEEVSIVTNINFDFDSAAIRDDAKPKLDRVIALMNETPNVVVRVVGYTDSTGPEAYNSELSLRRAESVREYMISRGIQANRVQAVGRGEANPLVPNTTAEGRAVNRRVEFEVVS